MKLNTVIFDMDGLLIDSEPLWYEAANEAFAEYGKKLSPEEYVQTTGLRTSEFVSYWMNDKIYNEEDIKNAGTKIKKLVLEKIINKGKPMPGYQYIFDFFYRKKFKIGIATSSPIEMVDAVSALLGISKYVSARTSAEHLAFGKPHPEVYLNCAASLNSSPLECICFEDSFNGMIAAKAARMKCVIVPSIHQAKDERWNAADLKLSSLQNFSELHFNLL